MPAGLLLLAFAVLLAVLPSYLPADCLVDLCICCAKSHVPLAGNACCPAILPLPACPQMFEYLLQQGADPAIQSFPAPAPGSSAAATSSGTTAAAAAQLLAPPLLAGQRPGQCLSVLDVAVDKGFGWAEGAVRAELQRLIEQYAAVPKKPAYLYRGPPLGEHCGRLGPARAEAGGYVPGSAVCVWGISNLPPPASPACRLQATPPCSCRLPGRRSPSCTRHPTGALRRPLATWMRR